MKRLAIVFALLWSGLAFAEPPEELRFPNAQVVTMRPGETRVFKFKPDVDRLGISEDNIIEVTSRTEGVFAFKGIKPGDTIVSAQTEDGRTVHQMRVVVGDNQVKIYGNVRDVPDYVGYDCNAYGCGSATNMPKASSTTVRQPLRGGGFVEKTY